MPSSVNRNVAFVFDMDGVIVDSNPVHEIALKQFCAKYGHSLSEEELREKIYGRRNRDWLEKVFGKLTEAEIKDYGEEKEALFRSLYEASIKPLAGLRDFLDQLTASGLPRCIATSAPRANVDFVLDRTGLTTYFDVILDDTFVKEGKPHPEVYLKAAAALVLEPPRTVVFEDSLAGVASARAAGCRVVGVTTTHTAEELRETDRTIPDFQGLHADELISSLFGR